MKKIDENFYGYIRVEGDTYTYNVSDNIVTLLPAQSDPQKRDDSLYRIKSHKTDTPEYLFGEDNNSMIAILRNGKFVTDPIGTNVAIRFATPIIIKACGNAEGFFNMLTEDWCKFHRLIRRVSMDQFYAILTGEEDAFYKMCMALPEVINSVVNEEGGVEVPHDTVIDELRKVASLYGDENGELSMAMAVYMLGFNTYMGFGEKICGELGEDRDGMLKRIYEYVRKMQK